MSGVIRALPWAVATVAAYIARRKHTLALDAAMLESRLAAQIRETHRVEDENRTLFFLARDLECRLAIALQTPAIAPAGEPVPTTTLEAA